MTAAASSPTRHRSRRAWAVGLLVLSGAAWSFACSAGAAEEAAIRQLATGSWRCDGDADDDSYQAFTVEVAGDGTFQVALDVQASAERSEMTGTWRVEEGDLDWGFDAPLRDERLRIAGFDDLTLDSTGFILDDGGLLAPANGSGEDGSSHRIEVEAHGTDSVTFREHGGDPWTCDRQ